MESFLDTQSLSTTASSSTPHTPSPSMNESTPVDYAYDQTAGAGAGHYYFDYQNHNHHQQHQHIPPMLSIEISHPSATAGPLYRRASFPFVQHDHSMSHYPKYAHNDQLDPESNGNHPPHQERGYNEYDDPTVDLDHHSSAMVVPTQIPQAPHHQHPHAFYRPSSSSSSVSSVSAPPGFLNPAMSSIPVMHTDDAASKETQYLRRKCFNCGTTEPPSWRRSTLNPGKIVCNKCGLYERTHNKPRPHQFGLRPGNKTRKQPQPQQQQQQHSGKIPSPSSSPKRHGLSIKKEQLDYSQAMRRGSIASINSGSGASDWDDHSGYSTASSAYHSSLGMAPPYNQQPHALSHHHHAHPSHVPNHHGHHPYNSALSMPPPRSTSHGIRLPQAPPMKVPTGNRAGSSSPITGPGVIVTSGGGNNSHSNLPHIHTGNGGAANSPDNMSMLSPSALAANALSVAGSPYGAQGISPSSNSGMPSSMYSPATVLRGPPLPPPLALPTPDYYARRGSTSQIPHHHHASSLYHEDMSTMRRGSVGAIGMGADSPSGMGYGSSSGGGGLAQRRLPPPSSWQPHYHQSGAAVPLSEMSLTPTPAPGGNNSTGSTPQQGYANVVHSATGATDLTPSPPHVMNAIPHGSGSGSAGASPVPIGASIPPEITSLAA